MKEIITYIQLHLISLEQDAIEIQKLMSNIEDWDSQDYLELEIEEISNNGQIIATQHILNYVLDLTKHYSIS